MEKYQFRIEEEKITNPDGWKDFELRLKRDDDIAGLLVTSTNKFTFKGDGYDILKSNWDNNYNDKVNVTIDILQADKSYIEQYKGVVILTEVKFNLEKRFAEATVEDASFQGAIQNNKNIKSYINAGLTKNGETVDVPTAFALDYFNAAGVYQSLANRHAYQLRACIDFLVRFMTDNVVKGIQSAYLLDITNWGGVLPYITTGIGIRSASQDAPNISFAQCMQFLQRTHDLTFDFITDSNGDPVMRIEEKSFFFQDTVQDTVRDISDLSVKVDSQRIYSHLEVGNNNAFSDGNCSSTTRWFSFQKEDYSLRGKGNIDKKLDLTTDFITDSNVIEDIVVSANTTFDDDIIIVLASYTQATQFQDTNYCSNSIIYNLSFTNNNIIDRQIDSIPNSITKYLTAATTPAKIELGDNITGNIPTPSPIPAIDLTRINFTDEQYDPGSNYNTSDITNTFYDIPFSGDYSFDISVKMIYQLVAIDYHDAGTTTAIQAAITFRITLQRFDSSFNTLKEEAVSTQAFDLNLITAGSIRTFVNTIQSTMACDTGDRLRVVVFTAISATNILSINFIVASSDTKTFFKCLGTPTDAGTFKVFDPNSFKAKQYVFEKNLSLTRTDALRANTRNSIVINELSDTNLDKTVWIEEMVNNIETGSTSFIAIK